MKQILAAVFIACAPMLALAQQPADPRIQLVDYDPDVVTTIKGQVGYQLMIEFAPEERIENVSIGDSTAWQVTPNRRANILFLKPVEGSATNMTVVTDLRRYVFDLAVQPKESLIPAPYTLRFVYPAMALAQPSPSAPPEPERPPTVANAAYAITGARESSPVRVFDDGTMTYFEWTEDSALPAIFAVNPDGSESLVNFVVRGRFMVVDQLAPRFSLRNGTRVATVVNSGFPAQPRRSRR